VNETVTDDSIEAIPVYVAVACQTCIRDVPGSSLGLVTGCHNAVIFSNFTEYYMRMLG
jgi:hypothetical protein